MDNNTRELDTAGASRDSWVVAQLEEMVAWKNKGKGMAGEAPVLESGLETFRGDYAVRALNALWEQAIEDQVALRTANPEAGPEAAGTLVLHFPQDEPCPSTRCGHEEAAGYSEAEVEFATMIVITNKVRNWTYFHDNRNTSGALVRVRSAAFVPGFGADNKTDN